MKDRDIVPVGEFIGFGAAPAEEGPAADGKKDAAAGLTVVGTSGLEKLQSALRKHHADLGDGPALDMIAKYGPKMYQYEIQAQHLGHQKKKVSYLVRIDSTDPRRAMIPQEAVLEAVREKYGEKADEFLDSPLGRRIVSLEMFSHDDEVVKELPDLQAFKRSEGPKNFVPDVYLLLMMARPGYRAFLAECLHQKGLISASINIYDRFNYHDGVYEMKGRSVNNYLHLDRFFGDDSERTLVAEDFVRSMAGEMNLHLEATVAGAMKELEKIRSEVARAYEVFKK